MADKKITELTNITGANLVDADEFVVVDISADETKAITLGELKEAFDSGSGFVRTTGDTMTGDLALSGADVTFGNNDKAIFGAGSDLQIYHDGSNSFVKESGTGNLNLASNGTGVHIINDTDSETMATFHKNGAVTLYYDNASKLATTSTGIAVTGNATFADNGKAIFGAGSDLEIYHDGFNTFIKDTGTGDLRIWADNPNIATASGNKMFYGNNGAAELYYNGGTPKLATTSTGVDITGTLTSDSLTVDGDVRITTNTDTNPFVISRLGTLDQSLQISVDDSVVNFISEQDETGRHGGFKFVGRHLGTDRERLEIDHTTGDISFYDSAGSSQSFFWDASAESLGIGTTSPATELDVQGTTTTNGLNLDAISETIADTAVDVFVYDTSKDSDGGAWRKRTQGTSWYNETLNTSTRGSRKEFPAVAVIVAESDTVTIYDGDDPSLPMWMVLNSNTNFPNYGLYGTNVYAISSVNGVLAVGSNERIHTVNFIADEIRWASSSTSAISTGISNREGSANVIQVASGAYLGLLVHSTVNDVAMTVLPNAPIDAATGLPVPTIAVATDGGVSVIKDDGTVVDITGANSYHKVMRLAFTPDNKIKYTLDYSGDAAPYSRYVRVDNIPSADFVATSSAHLKGNSLEFYSAIPTVDCDLYFLADINTVANPNIVIGKAYGTKFGLTTQDRNPTAPASGSVAYITSDYNTGWQNGAIKLATLSDTDDTDVTGSELVADGGMATAATFASPSAYWDFINAGMDVNTTTAGKLYIPANAGDNQYAYNIGGTVADKTKAYVLTFTISNSTANYGFRIWTSTVAKTLNTLVDGVYYTANGTYTVTIPANKSAIDFVLTFERIAGHTGVLNVDDVTLRLAEEDRSVNGNGLQVFGSITKNPVNSGADLVAYSGFTTSNYLQQPYNSDLDFGTGDFCVMGWVKQTAAATGRVFEREGGTNDNYVIMYTSNGAISVATKEGSAKTVIAPTSPLGVWQHFTAVRSGGVLYLYMDGVSVGTPVANSDDITNVGAPVFFGIRTNGTSPFTYGSLALFRMSATAPSPEAIKKIYEDEKVLFQENAKAVLHGTSDAVTALAFDDTTNLLHVGTSAGRSVFQGLRRVDNTTTAVTSAISASNGLVADE